MKGFLRALVCGPADTLNQGLRMENLGEVDVVKARIQHKNYCLALEELGFRLISFPADNKHPDSVFVEDPAVIMEDLLVMLRLRCLERQGEEKRVRQILAPYFSKVINLDSSGFVEGGDVLILERELCIGISKRTDGKGAEALAKIARDLAGFKSRVFEIPSRFLHLKGGASFQGDTGVLVVSEEILVNFNGVSCRPLAVPVEERFGANCISRGKKLIMHSGKPKTKKILGEAGFLVQDIDVSEFEKIDGALTCMSKIF